MTVQASNLESEQLPDPTGAPDGDLAKIAGQSPTRLAIGRFRKDRLSMVSFVIVALYVLVGVAAPFLVHFGVLDPFTLHNQGDDTLLNADTLPLGSWGGVSSSHPLGVEPGTGRDIFARILTGLTTSLTVAILATIISLVIGVILGIVAGFARGRTDWWISRFMDLVLSFPSTLMLLSLQLILVQLIANAMGQSVSAAPPKIVFMVVVLGFFGFPQIARIIRGQVLSLREREFIEAAQ